MMTRRQANAVLVSAAILAGASGAGAEATTTKELPPPRATGGKPLIDALKLRRSIREYADRSLPPQVLSDLLWAAFGVNRPSGDRTAPYWRHVMVIDVYAALADGAWLYDPKQHRLERRLDADVRSQTGTQDFVGTAPLNLIYVAHGERMQDISPEDRRLYASVDTGFRMSTCSARRKDSPRYSGGRSTPRGSGRRCSSATGSSSRSRKRWDTRAPERRPSKRAECRSAR